MHLPLLYSNVAGFATVPIANPESVTKTAEALTENEAGFAATIFGETDAGVAAFQTYSKDWILVFM